MEGTRPEALPKDSRTRLLSARAKLTNPESHEKLQRSFRRNFEMLRTKIFLKFKSYELNFYSEI